MRGRPYALIHEQDAKTGELSRGMEALGARLEPVRGTLAMPWVLLRRTLSWGRPRAVVYRYMNDHPGLGRTWLRFLSELASMLLTRLLGVRLVWLCHNVDRETTTYHPRLAHLRRSLFARTAHAVLVTDPLLVPHAARVFPRSAAKIDFITFGAYVEPGNGPRIDALTERVRAFAESIRKERPHYSNPPRVGLCAGHASWKTAQFQRIPELLERAEALGRPLRMVVVGPVREYLAREAPEVLRFLREDPRVLLEDGYVPIDERALAPLVDFYWRAYRDLSVPFTVYHAAYLGKPVLAQGPGFVAEFVGAYGLGAVVREDFSNLDEALSALERWDRTKAERFLKTHSWEIGARRLARACAVPVGDAGTV